MPSWKWLFLSFLFAMSSTANTGGDAGDLAYYQEQLSQVKSLLDQDPENAEIKEVSRLGFRVSVGEVGRSILGDRFCGLSTFWGKECRI